MKLKRKLISLLAALALCAGLLPASLTVSAEGTLILYLEDGNVEVSSAHTIQSAGESQTFYYADTYEKIVITMRDSSKSTSNRIIFNGFNDSVSITIQDLNYSGSFSAIEVGDKTTTITFSGTNTLSSSGAPAIWVSTGSLTLTGTAGATLSASTSSFEPAAIGSDLEEDFSGSITITSGTVNASAGYYGAGIGSGHGEAGDGEGAFSGKINITGGTVNASSVCGAGIGSGTDSGFSGSINISGGKVTGSSTAEGAGIGSGMDDEFSGSINISGGTVTGINTGSTYCGAGIGTGYGTVFSGSINITGGTVTASSTNSKGIGVGVYGTVATSASYKLICGTVSNGTTITTATTADALAAVVSGSTSSNTTVSHSYGEGVVTVPTCTDKGYTTYTCACGDKYTGNETSATGHDWESEYTVDTPATCTTDGSQSHHCKNCDATTDVTAIPATGHTTEIKNAKDATCTESGYTGDEVCTVCGETVTSGTAIPATGHTTETKNAQDATCTESGYTGDEVCTVCGETVTSGQVIPATGHTTETKNALAATCTADGYTGDEVCTVCGETITAGEVIPATGHTTETKNAQDATCTTDGYTGDEVCTVCGETVTSGEVIPATGHKYTTQVVAATYTEQGYTIYTCECGDSYMDDYTAILVLDGKDSSVSTQTTVQSLTVLPDGLKGIYSSVDELIADLISRIVATTGYTEDNTLVYDVMLQYSTDGGATWITATVDNFPTDGITVTLPYPEGTDSTYDFAVLHMFTVDSARLGITAGDTESPTVTTTDDGLVFTLTGLSPVAISWSAPTTTNTTTTTSAKTGDSSGVGIWVVVMLAALAAAGGTVFYMKKKL